MSVRADSMFWFRIPEHIATRRDIGPGPKLLFARLADYSTIRNNGTASPGVRRLAEDLGASTNSILKWVRELQAVGLVAVETGTGRSTNRYRPIVPDTAPDSRSVAEIETQTLFGSVSKAETQTSVVSQSLNRSVSDSETNQDHDQDQLTKTISSGVRSKAKAKKKTASKIKREPDPIWDALCEEFRLKPVTKGDKSRVGKVVRDLKLKEATPEEIASRAERLKDRWGMKAYTPESFLKHWDQLDGMCDDDNPARVREPRGKYDHPRIIKFAEAG